MGLTSTPNLDGLPCLERMILEDCINLKEIHPSIGYHEKLVFLNMVRCESLEMFPPIIQMKKLETLLLSYCSKLRKFPKIQMNMDNLVDLHLRKSGIEILPASIGQYCTNLLSLDLRDCTHLQSIEGNFRLLKHLKGLYLKGCNQLKIPSEGLFDVECCLQVLSLPCISFKNPMNCRVLEENFYRGMASMKLHDFSRFLRRLSLRFCNLDDGDLSSVLCELSNLQVFDLSGNNFSQLHSSLSQLPCLKFLNLSLCRNLVELPHLPSSITILKAEICDSLEIANLQTNYKWLWKVSLSMDTKLSGGERLVQSMLQGYAIEDYFISVHFDGTNISTRNLERETFMLHLPWNWYNDFNGFLIYVVEKWVDDRLIVIKDVMGMDYKDDVFEAFDEIPKIDEMSGM